MSKTIAKPTRTKSPTIKVRALTANDWPHIELLFGEKGACGGCWCMTWRHPRGGKLWEDNKGARNKQAFRKLVTTGKVYGCLAFSGDEPVGWCCVGPREDFPKLQRARSLRTNWSDGTWSVTCFYIPAAWRGKGVATTLLQEATKLAKKNGARELEAYPSRPTLKDGTPMPPAFAFTGVPALFEKCKFSDITPSKDSRYIYLKKLR